jgi:hypothetical protein
MPTATVLPGFQRFGFVASSQFIDKMLQTGRRFHLVWTKGLLETLAHGVAYRPAGPAIERFDVIRF